MLVGLASVEGRGFELQHCALEVFGVPEREAAGDDAVADVRGILQVVTERRERQFGGRGTMNERDGTERRLGRRTGVDEPRSASGQVQIVESRDLAEDVMRVL